MRMMLQWSIMRDNLLNPLKKIDSAAAALLSETDLNFDQEQIISMVQTGTATLTELVVTMPDFTLERARDVMSFESRSHLASIIGYAEVLLEQTDTLSQRQQDLLHTIRASGKQVLAQLIQLEG